MNILKYTTGHNVWLVAGLLLLVLVSTCSSLLLVKARYAPCCGSWTRMDGQDLLQNLIFSYDIFPPGNSYVLLRNFEKALLEF